MQTDRILAASVLLFCFGIYRIYSPGESGMMGVITLIGLATIVGGYGLWRRYRSEA